MEAQTNRQVIPETGMSIYDYSKSNLTQVSRRTWVTGLFVTLFTLFVGIMVLVDSVPVNSPVVYYMLPLFLVIGLAMMAWGLPLFLTSRHSELDLYPDGFSWRDSLGRSSSRIRYDQLLRCTVNNWNKPYFLSMVDHVRHRHFSPTHFKVTLVTTSGTFTFFDDISGYSKLRDYFLAIQTAPSADGVFRYWNATWFSVGLLVLPVCGFFTYFLFNGYKTGMIVYINRHPVPMPLWFLCLFLVVLSIFFLFGVYQVLCSLFQRVVVSNGKVVTYNWFGWPTVRARLDQIEHGSFEKGSSGIRSVQTLKGEISWGWGISNYSTLNDIMLKASEESMLGKESGEPIA